MLSFAEFEVFVRSLGEKKYLTVQVRRNERIEVEIHGFDSDHSVSAEATTFLEALEMARAAWDARRPKGVRGLLPPKKTKLRSV